jgi:hypothetical protein
LILHLGGKVGDQRGGDQTGVRPVWGRFAAIWHRHRHRHRRRATTAASCSCTSTTAVPALHGEALDRDDPAGVHYDRWTRVGPRRLLDRQGRNRQARLEIEGVCQDDGFVQVAHRVEHGAGRQEVVARARGLVELHDDMFDVGDRGRLKRLIEHLSRPLDVPIAVHQHEGLTSGDG